jgi:assimilatory nitrate reductase catalytic subunit
MMAEMNDEQKKLGSQGGALGRPFGEEGLREEPLLTETKGVPPSGTIRTTCGYCSVGCNLDVLVEDGVPLKVLPAKDYPVNLGKTCSKGFNLLKALESSDRALAPSLRDRLTGERREISWDEAAATFADRFKAIQKKYGPESVAFLSTGQMPFEEQALLGAVGKFGMGIRHGDGNTRQCMASAVVTYKQAFGFDAPGFAYTDIEQSDCLIFLGANPAIAHPILWQRLKNNPHSPTVVVIDPRKTETAKEATLHLAIEPKSDLTLLYTLAHVLIEKGWVDPDFIADHTNGYEEFRDHVADFTPEAAVRYTGLTAVQILGLADLFHTKKAVSLWWTMGVNQSHQGVRTAQAIVNLCLMTGHIGRPGTGPNSITGQCNAMGSRLFSNTSNMLGGHDFGKPEHRAKVSRVLGVPEDLIPPDAGKNYDQILEAIEAGTIKGLWIICTNPAHSWIDQNSFRHRMEALDFLVVQDIYHSTETAQLADLVLPAAGSAEKNGTFINSERRLGIVQKVKQAPGQAKTDFEIFQLLGRAWGGMEPWLERWTDPEAAFELLKELSRDQPCDITGIRKWKDLDRAGGIQWPWTASDAEAAQTVYASSAGAESSDVYWPQGEEVQRRLFADGKFFTPDGKAKFLFTDVVPLPEIPDETYPFFLLTGRGSMHQWHTQTRTGKVEMLKKMYPAESYAEVNPSDAQRLGIAEGTELRVTSRRGTVKVKAAVKDSVRPGFVFLPMHYPEANYLTFPVFDPHSRQPGYKFGAVKVEVVS